MFSEPLLDEFQGSATAREDILSGFCPLRELGVFFPLLSVDSWKHTAGESLMT